ncbi:formimidoylglutamase [Halobacterium salinarum]|uniref:formimidoylglutamase n=1 Tax=Halobacterium salinarum TaxID=2242 RepID=UPI001F168DC6|nr:formimidoylglutamase [Halobacterium salinarum]MCF2165089.1 formimidoylglutamase [Halobacterium salinarum]MCF2168102.1 formimidoylglutamase [Halobacterium salinarum]MCF2238272.1 formimidoylglutamase [Halobacterium salinarum]MDL0140522.1 formimidoylglutamase [Halobacterium salinarum]
MFQDATDWAPTSTDPRDEQFGGVVEPVPTPSDADDYDAVLVGEPYDGAVIGRRGARDGPSAIRESLAGVKTHHFDAGAVSGVADLGNVVLPDGDVADTQAAVSEAAAEVHETAALPVFVGGDNSLSYANVAPLVAADNGAVGVVSVDAHLDCRAVGDRGPTSGTPYRQLFDAGLDALAVVGARHFETTTAYAGFLREQGGRIVTSDAVAADRDGSLDVAREALDGVDHVYVSVDIDVLDAAYPGASAPTPGGIQPRELFALVEALAASDDRIRGFELVETAPTLDTGGRTVDAAARTIAHFLAGAQ